MAKRAKKKSVLLLRAREAAVVAKFGGDHTLLADRIDVSPLESATEIGARLLRESGLADGGRYLVPLANEFDQYRVASAAPRFAWRALLEEAKGMKMQRGVTMLVEQRRKWEMLLAGRFGDDRSPAKGVTRDARGRVEVLPNDPASAVLGCCACLLATIPAEMVARNATLKLLRETLVHTGIAAKSRLDVGLHFGALYVKFGEILREATTASTQRNGLARFSELLRQIQDRPSKWPDESLITGLVASSREMTALLAPHFGGERPWFPDGSAGHRLAGSSSEERERTHTAPVLRVGPELSPIRELTWHQLGHFFWDDAEFERDLLIAGFLPAAMKNAKRLLFWILASPLLPSVAITSPSVLVRKLKKQTEGK
jgi:hypothetical protein